MSAAYVGDSCSYSPARLPGAITVNASDTDADSLTRPSPNYGACSDIYAPGVDITSAGITKTPPPRVKSGTSMAAPHVAGAAARILGMNPAFTPAQVWDAINAAATTVNFGPADPDPNKLLYIPTPPAAPRARRALGDETMTVSWTPADHRRQPHHLVHGPCVVRRDRRDAVGSCQPAPLTGLTCTITGLTNGTTYYVDATASNVASVGAASTPRTTSLLPVLVPTAPRSIAATAADSSAA